MLTKLIIHSIISLKEGINMAENIEKDVSWIELSKIDSKIIPAIRSVQETDEHYEILKNSLQKDGQLHPITVRRLTNEERSNNSCAEYGIIDGHHRFAIAENLGWNAILTKDYELKCDENQIQEYLDNCLAFRLNESSIKMTTVEKGEVISKFMEKFSKSAEEIGEEIFGLKVAMAYRCVNAYKKSTGIATTEKPRKNKLTVKDFKDIFSADVQALKELVPKKSSLEAILSNAKSCDDTLEKITNLERDLKWVKKRLNEAKANFEKSEDQSAETDNGNFGLPSEDSAQ